MLLYSTTEICFVATNYFLRTKSRYNLKELLVMNMGYYSTFSVCMSNILCLQIN